MTRSGLLLAAGIAAVVVVAGTIAVVRTDEPVPLGEAVPSQSTGFSTTTRVGTPVTSVASPTTVSAAEDSPTTAAQETRVPPVPTDGEPGVEFVDDPVPAERSGGRSASGEELGSTGDDEKEGPVAQAGTGNGAEVSPSTTVGESGVELEGDPILVEPKETTASTAAASEPRGGSGSVRQGRMYTWEDGGNTRQVWLDPGLVVKSGSAVGSLSEVVVEAAAGSVVRSDEGTGESGWPVFRSPSGALMALPGGVLLVLDSEWSDAETSAFFSRNGIKQARVSELGYLANGFFVETDPGFPSLNLANELAGQDGVELSSPNWWTESSTR